MECTSVTVEQNDNVARAVFNIETILIRGLDKRNRQEFIGFASWVLFLLTCLVMQSAPVQNPALVGPPVDPRKGCICFVGGTLTDFGYESSREIFRYCTMGGFFVALFSGYRTLRKAKDKAKVWLLNGASDRVSKMLVTRALWCVLFWLIAIPVSIHSFGTYYLNNYLGLGL